MKGERYIMKINNGNQEETRQALLRYINERGSKYCYVAARIGLTAPVISRFRHGANLWDESLLKLQEFLKSEGF